MLAADLRSLINLIESADRLDRATESRLYAAMNTLAEFSSSHMQSDRLDQAYDIVMQYLPDAHYTGVMYRGFGVSPDALSRADLVDEIKKKMQSYQRQVLSWSQDPQVAQEFAAENGIGVVMQQRATGIDTDNLYYEPTDFSVDGGFSGEEEVLARLDPSATILGFVADDEDKLWPAADIAQFLNYVKQNY